MTVDGRAVPVVRWHDSRIIGVLPSDITSGVIVVDGPTGVHVGKF